MIRRITTATFTALVFAGLLATHPPGTAAAIVAADWDTTSSGTLNGIGFRIAGITGGPFDAINTQDFVGPDFSAGPLISVEALDYSVGMSYTVSFDMPVTGLLLYAGSWRGGTTALDDPPITYTFDKNFTVLSGFPDATFTANTLTIDDEFNNFDSGILRFAGSLSSLQVMPDTMNLSGQRLTLALQVHEPATLALLGVALAGLGFSRRRKLLRLTSACGGC